MNGFNDIMKSDCLLVDLLMTFQCVTETEELNEFI